MALVGRLFFSIFEVLHIMWEFFLKQQQNYSVQKNIIKVENINPSISPESFQSKIIGNFFFS
jgi:hypothetical protein